MRFFLFSMILLGGTAAHGEAGPWRAGLARVDVTPTEPVRMSGYGNRDRPSEGIDTPLYVRAVALQHGDGPPHVLVSVDSIGLSASLVRELTEQLEREHSLARRHVVFASSHTHCAPDLVSQLSNIFAVEMTEAEVAAGKRYRQQLREGILAAVRQALASLAPAQLAYGSGEVNFAANRRALSNGRWSGFGVETDGPVDHSVPVLRITAPDGQVRGVVFNYACHCTTLGGDYYRINADWAGYAATALEAAYPDAIALCTIGCGADANPNPRGTREICELHGRALAREVQRVVSGDMATIDKPITSNFGHAGLSFDLPTAAELEQRLEHPTPQFRRHARHFLQVIEREGRLPATYPVPIQSWQFDDQLTMIFLGGEVVVDYALRLERELPSPLWVTAYANDVLGYIASERMRAEGGYEVDDSGIYYNLPGPWAAGSEDLLIRRVHELFDGDDPQPPLEPHDALRSIVLPEGFTVQLVASEPLVQDPINLAFGHDGSLWVVEMGDYPLGAAAESGGRVKRLVDADRDGVFDRATTFLDQLSFPTAVHPWGDGVIVIAAPDIFLARDRDGDGRADDRQVLVTGLAEGNPQHRTNGFAYGLDHSLHCAAAEHLGEVTVLPSGEVVDASGRDLQLWPDEGRAAPVSGRTQFIRSRNDWGDWFGSDNSRPMFHYPIEDRYFQRNRAARFPTNKQLLFDPPVAPPVYPLSNTSDRFNDLFAANRFTSACSAIVVRSSALGKQLEGAALVCEPVHNLVHRAVLVEQKSTYRAERVGEEQSSEFLRSTDPWFRPVRVTVGPDGMIWIADMYRAVIEHPQWIPTAWQQQIDLYAGHDRGRIYRVVPSTRAAPPILPNIASRSNEELIGLLESDNGTLRDMVQQELLQRGDSSVAGALERVCAACSSPHARLHALWTLQGLNALRDETLIAALRDQHPGVVRNAILLAEPRIATSEALLSPLVACADHSDDKVILQLVLTLGNSAAPQAGAALAKLAAGAADDPWLAHAVVSSSGAHSLAVLESVLWRLRRGEVSPAAQSQLVATITDLIATSQHAGHDPTPVVLPFFEDAEPHDAWVFALAAALARTNHEKERSGAYREMIASVYERARSLARDIDAPETLRCQALQLFGNSLGSPAEEQAILTDLVTPSSPMNLQWTAARQLMAFGDRTSAEQLLSRWSVMTHQLREMVSLQLTYNVEAVEVLVERLESGAIGPVDLSPAVRQALRQSGSRSLQARVDRLLGKPVAANDELIQKYLRFQQEAQEMPDVARGGELYGRHCAACHTPDETGMAIAPNLLGLSDRSPQALTEAILTPNRSVEPKYHSYVVLTLDGRVLTGAIFDEAGDTLTLSLADGKRMSLHRSEIDELEDTRTSLMPEEFHRELDPAMLRDLVEYLRSDTFTQSASVP